MLKQLWTWIAGGLVSLSAILLFIVRDKVSETLKTEITPALSKATCSATDWFKSNKAHDRFTVVVLPFENDKDDTIRRRIREALGGADANDFGLNVISSCKTVGVSPEGNHDENVKRARQAAVSILDHYDADVLVFGSIDLDAAGHPTKDSSIVHISRATVPYLFDGSRIQQVFDPNAPETFTLSQDFLQSLLFYGKEIGESSGCFSPLLAACGLKPKDMSREALSNKIERIDQIMNLFMKRHLIRASDQSGQLNFFKLGIFASAIALHLEMKYGVKSLPSEHGAEDIFTFAESRIHDYDFLVAGMEPDRPVDGREIQGYAGIVELYEAEADKKHYGIETAVADLEAGKPLFVQGEPSSDQGLVSVLYSLKLGRAKLEQYALSSDRDSQTRRTEFEAIANEAVSTIPSDGRLLFITSLFDDNDQLLGDELRVRIQSERDMILLGLHEKDRLKLRNALKL